MSNSLTRKAGLRLGPLVLETLVKHYFDRIKKENAQRSNFATQLHQDELLYHEAFNIVKVRFGVNHSSTPSLGRNAEFPRGFDIVRAQTRSRIFVSDSDSVTPWRKSKHFRTTEHHFFPHPILSVC